MPIKRSRPTIRGAKPKDIEAKELQGRVDAVIMRNEENGFAILKVNIKGEPGYVSVKGPLAHVNVGEDVTCNGRWKSDEKYGWGFSVQDVRVEQPLTKTGIIAYLQNTLPGVGPVLAQKIVGEWGENTIKILDENPQRLLEIKGVPSSKMEDIALAWEEKKGLRDVMLFLNTHKVSANKAARLYQAYGQETMEVLRNDPYRITELPMIGFKTADEIAIHIGYPLEGVARIDAGIRYILEQGEERGHVYLPFAQVLKASHEDLHINNTELVRDRIKLLAEEGRIILDKPESSSPRVYNRELYDLEGDVAKMIKNLVRSGPALAHTDIPKLRSRLHEDNLTTEQWQAVAHAFHSRVSVLTGGPGTGKCVRGDTEVVIHGERLRIAQLWELVAGETEADGEGEWRTLPAGMTTWALTQDADAAGTEPLVEAPVSRIYRQYVEETGVRLLFADGQKLVMTARHRVYTRRGWSNELAVGDEVAFAVPGGPGLTTAWTTITSLESAQLSTWVYDLEVPVYHSYLANGIVTHNTTSLKTLLEIADLAGVKYELAAPTGKAAKRFGEVTGRPAKTIHRLLKWSPFDKEFAFNRENPLVSELLIVDEVSMVDLQLSHSLLQALGPRQHLIFIGDPDQLPSVGAGKFLDDLLEVREISITKLTKIFRQAAKSLIIQNSRKINKGEFPYSQSSHVEGVDDSELVKDFFFVPRKEDAAILNATVDFVVTRIPKWKGYDPIRDIQVYAPMRGGPVGLDKLNSALQWRLNEKGQSVGYKNFRVGDKIIQTKNNYDYDLMNGETAIIRAADRESSKVSLETMDGVKIDDMPYDELWSFMLAYAISIHRSQGSQSPAVVIPLSTSHYVMLRRNLLYTAVTRAEQLCVLVGQSRAVQTAVSRVETRKRCSGLSGRVNSLLLDIPEPVFPPPPPKKAPPKTGEKQRFPSQVGNASGRRPSVSSVVDDDLFEPEDLGEPEVLRDAGGNVTGEYVIGAGTGTGIAAPRRDEVD